MEFGNDPPADQAAAAELDRLIQDPTHPQHAAFWRNEKSAVEYRDNLAARAFPGVTHLRPIDTATEQIFAEASRGQSPSEAWHSPQQPAQQSDSGQQQSGQQESDEAGKAADAQYFEQLRQIHGDQFDSRLLGFREAVGQIFTGR